MRPKFLYSFAGGLAAAMLLVGSQAAAHTNSVGFKISVSGTTTCVAGTGDTCYDVEVFYGTWHNGVTTAEGDLAIFIQDSGGGETQVIGQSAAGGSQVPFSTNHSLTGTIPNNPSTSYSDTAGTPYSNLQSAFDLGTEYFFHDDSATALVGTPNSGVSAVWSHQSADAVGLGEGTYRIAYDAATSGSISATWQPQTAVQQLTFTIGEGGTIDVTDTVGDTDPPVIDGPGTAAGAATSEISIAEGQTAVTTFTADETVTWALSGGADQALVSINASSGTLTFDAAPDYETPTDADTNNTYVVDVQATDDSGNSATQTLTVTVTDIVDTPEARFEEEKEEIVRILRDTETGRLRAALAFNQRMVRDARERFIAGQAAAGCTTFEDERQAGGATELDCPDIVSQDSIPFDVDGSFTAGPDGIATAGEFFGQTASFDGRVRRVVFGDFSVYHNGEGVRTLSFSGQFAYERTVSESLMWGVFARATVGRSQIASGGFTGDADATGLAVGAYAVKEIVENIYLDGFLVADAGWNTLDLTSVGLDVAGDYTTTSLQAGGAVSGVLDYGRYEVWPQLEFAMGISRIGTAEFDVGAFSSTASVETGISDVKQASLRFTPELRVPLDRNDLALVSVAPSVLCESVDGDRSCGAGMRVKLRDGSADGRTRFEARLDMDSIEDMDSYRLSFNFSHRF